MRLSNRSTVQPSGKPQFSFSRVRRGLRVVVPDRGRRRHPVRRSPLAGTCLQKTTQFFTLNLLQNWKGLSHEVTRLACFTGCRHQTELPEQEDQLRGRLNFRAVGGDRRPLRLQHQPRADADKASKNRLKGDAVISLPGKIRPGMTRRDARLYACGRTGPAIAANYPSFYRFRLGEWNVRSHAEPLPHEDFEVEAKHVRSR